MIMLVSEVEAKNDIDIPEEEQLISSQKFEVPVYHSAIYPNLYNDKKWFDLFSRPIINNLLSLFCRDKLVNSILDEIEPQSKVLQMGISFGDEITAVADQIGFKGRFDIIDVNYNQINFCQEYLEDNYPQVKFYHFNAETELPEKYDVIICYMLLHELPIASKINVVNNALNSIREKGKVIFVDYGRPMSLNPLSYFVRMFNRLYQPFAEKLWDREIDSFADKDLDFNWNKQKFLGGLYQRVVVTRKEKDVLMY